jgi:hypothetical protein
MEEVVIETIVPESNLSTPFQCNIKLFLKFSAICYIFIHRKKCNTPTAVFTQKLVIGH